MARRGTSQGEGGTCEALYRNHAHARREQLHAEWRVGFAGGCTFGWCRGPGLHRSLGSFLFPGRSMMPVDEGGFGPMAASLQMRKNL